MFPVVRITPEGIGRTAASKHFSKPAGDVNRSKHKPVFASICSAVRPQARASVSTPSRKSLDGVKTLDSALAPALQSCMFDTDCAAGASEQQHGLNPAIPHSASTTSLSSDSDLSLLLRGADITCPGTTTITIGSIPITVPLAYVDVPKECKAGSNGKAAASSSAAGHNEEPFDNSSLAEVAAEGTEASAVQGTKLKATSAEFYPQAYATTAAATTLAVNSAQAAVEAVAAETAAQIQPNQQHQYQQGYNPAQQILPEQQRQPGDSTAVAVAEVATQAQPDQQPHYQQAERTQPQPQHNMEQQQQQQQPPEAMQPQVWHYPQQQWQQHAVAVPMPMWFPLPMPMPPYMMPAYHYAYQHPQQYAAHMQAVAAGHHVAAPGAAAAAAASHQALGTLSPAPSLPADTNSLLSAPTATNWSLAHTSSLYGSSSRPGSSASSVVSGYVSSRSRQQRLQAVPRDAGVVTVSALSCVKDAAGALAKVVNRHGGCLLMSLTRVGDQPAQATHIAAKSLAVARFYINANMAAAGTAGIDAAAALTGVEVPAPTAVADEVIFMPCPSSSSSSHAAADMQAPLDFLVAKASAKDLLVQLPPPVGIPACMQDRQQQQQQPQPPQLAVPATSSSNEVAQQGSPLLLKAGANTDVNKLSNAIIHNILGCGHVAMQLAGAAACHVAMQALIKAGSRLQRKFNMDIAATASFANEDTSSSIGRSTVFLRLDVMRSSLLKQLAPVHSVPASVAETVAGSDVAAP